ncbi:MAG: hypothetical protein ACLFNK_02575 [Candidatus Woesearchaeota archaeon]
MVKRRRKSEKMKGSSKEYDMSLIRAPSLFTLLLLIIIVPILYTLIFSPVELSGSSDMYELSGRCSLSLCDCRCYFTEELPEVTNSKICGNDCYGMMDIKGCELVNDTCEVVYSSHSS